MKGYLRKKLGALYPAGAAEETAIAKIPEGSLVAVELTRPRKQERLRFWWALCGWMEQQIGDERYSRKNISDLFKVLTGHCDILVSPSGKEFRFPKSISFSELSEEDFGELTGKLTHVAYKMLLKFGQENWTAEEVERCVREYENTWS